MNTLFEKADWHSFVEGNRNGLSEEINKLDGNRLLNSSEEDLVKYFHNKYYFDVPVLTEDEISVDQSEVDVDVSRDPNRFFFDRSGPFYVKGTKITFYVPFTGEEIFFSIRPSRYYMQQFFGEIRNNCLIYSISNVEQNPERVKVEFENYLRQIKEYLLTQRQESSSYNNSLESTIRGMIGSRKQKLLKDKNVVSSLGYKLKENPNESKTYAAPISKKKVIQLPPASNQPYKPEPALLDDDYNNILAILENMTHVMERSPTAFKDINEESLRMHFLMQLNGQYEGSATGETFNYNGKTDILIRINDKNIFIAECKFWKGKIKYLETIDQILGYSSWRDTKVAILLFNRNKNMSKVLEEIDSSTKEHKNYKREIKITHETQRKYIFSQISDANRELFLTVMVFDVPNE